MKLCEILLLGMVTDFPDDYYMIREKHIERQNHPTWRMRLRDNQLLDDTGNAYPLTAEDVTADDWTIQPLKCSACESEFITASELERDECWYCGGPIPEEKRRAA